jgi:hypothetical protein
MRKRRPLSIGSADRYLLIDREVVRTVAKTFTDDL